MPKAREIRFCEICGNKSREWHTHHKDCDHYNNANENLQTLCRYCHGKEHGGQYYSDNAIGFGALDREIANYNYNKRLKDGFAMMKD